MEMYKRLYRVEGNAYERGKQAGEQMNEQMKANYNNQVTFYKNQGYDYADWEAIAERRYVPILEKWAPEVLDEVRGMADGSDLSFAQVLAMTTAYEKSFAVDTVADKHVDGKCTSFLATGEATKGGQTVIGQTNDEDLIEWIYQLDVVVHHVDPETGKEQLIYTHPGVPAYMGMNNDGVAVLWTYIDNGLLADADFISFHTYGNVAELEPLIEDMRKTEQLSGSPNLGIPYWITECGKPRPYAGVSRGTTAPDQFSAVEIAGKAAEFRALGIERHFAFEYKFRKENANNFGLMDFNRTPMRGMAAYTHLVRVLSHRHYLGDLQGTNAFRARVFAGENDLVAVLYNGLKEQRKQYVNLPRTLKPLRATGIDGRPLPIANGRVSNADGITYLYFTQPENPGWIHPETRAMKLYRLAKSYRPRARAARPLVLQSTTDLSNFIISNRGFFLPNPDELELKVLVNNFGSTALKFHPEVEVPAGASLLQRPEAVIIPAGGRTEVRFRIALNAGIQSTFQTVRLTDSGGNATPIAFSLAPFLRREVEIHEEPVGRPIPSSLSGLRASGSWIDFSGPANWTPWEGDKTTPDIEAGFRAFYTPEELVFLVLVKDARHVNPYSAFESWQGDSVQLTIQQRGADKNPVLGKRFHEIAAARSREGDLLYAHIGTPRGVLQNSKLEFRPLEKGWFLYIIRLNGKELGLTLKPGSILGSSMLVNSNPGSGRAGFLTWGFGISPEKNDVLFQLLRLK